MITLVTIEPSIRDRYARDVPGGVDILERVRLEQDEIGALTNLDRADAAVLEKLE